MLVGCFLLSLILHISIVGATSSEDFAVSIFTLFFSLCEKNGRDGMVALSDLVGQFSITNEK